MNHFFYFLLIICIVFIATHTSAKKTPQNPWMAPLYAYLQKPLETPKSKTARPSNLDIRLKFIIEHHPLTEISKDMFQDIYINEKLAYSYLEEEGLVAQFEETPVTDETTKQKKFVPVIIIDPKLLLNFDSEEKVYRALIVIYHEYLHYQQWQQSNTTDKLHFRLTGPSEHPDKKTCELIWKNEREAYFKECQVAVKWGKPEVISKDLCTKTSSKKAFNEHLFEVLEHNMPSKKLVESCSPVWKKTSTM